MKMKKTKHVVVNMFGDPGRLQLPLVSMHIT
jgi:hypothetical protein